MRHILLLLLLLSQVFFSPAVYSAELFPFKVGAQWIYQIEGGTSDLVTNHVAEKRTIKGITWYRLVEYGSSFWVRNNAQGQIEAIDYYDDLDPDEHMNENSVLVFKYPAKVGDKWDNNESPTLYRGQKTITVPAGTFSCHEYYIRMDDVNYSLSCIAIDVGVVYNETKIDGVHKEISRLVSYKK